MNTGRIFVSAVSALALAACGGGGSDNNNSTGGSNSPPTATPAPSAQCSLSARQTWVSEQLNQYYLFPDLIDNSVNPANFTDLQAYIDALVKPARDKGFDNGFTFITSIEEENAQINTGRFQPALAFCSHSMRIIDFLSEKRMRAHRAFNAGFDRGVQITAIGGRTVASLLADDVLSEAFGPPDPGVTRTFQIIDNSGVSREISVTKAVYELDPVSDRYGVRIFNDGGTQVGYLALRTFFARTAEAKFASGFRAVSRCRCDRSYFGFPI